MRTAIFVLLGLILLVLNVWFLRALQESLLARDLVLAPFEIIGPAEPRKSEPLARILNVRLSAILRDIAAARAEASAPGNPKRDAQARAAALPAATLFLPEEVVVPIELLRPVDIRVAVAGVEVGGLLSWLHSTFLRPRTLTFTVVEKGEKATVTADLTGFIAGGDPHISFECANAPDEIASAAAYALIQRRLGTEGRRTWRTYFADLFSKAGPPDAELEVMRLDPADFRLLLESVLSVNRINASVRRGYVLDQQLQSVLEKIEPLTAKLPDYYELQYFVASVASAGGNKVQAARWFRSVLAAPAGAVSAAILASARDGLSGVEVSAAFAGTDPRQQQFVQESTRFAELMGLQDSQPTIVFKAQNTEGVQAFWNVESHQYEVDPKFVDTPGLPQYVALMGRFMERHFDRCFGKEPSRNDDWRFWNDFRHGIVDYLIRSVPEFSKVELTVGDDRRWFAMLQRIEAETGQPPTRFALELLNRYDCSWRAANFETHAVAIAKERGLAAPEIVQRAFRDTAPAPPSASAAPRRARSGRRPGK